VLENRPYYFDDPNWLFDKEIMEALTLFYQRKLCQFQTIIVNKYSEYSGVQIQYLKVRRRFCFGLRFIAELVSIGVLRSLRALSPFRSLPDDHNNNV
jgi:hypothetical protein